MICGVRCVLGFCSNRVILSWLLIFVRVVVIGVEIMVWIVIVEWILWLLCLIRLIRLLLVRMGEWVMIVVVILIWFFVNVRIMGFGVFWLLVSVFVSVMCILGEILFRRKVVVMLSLWWFFLMSVGSFVFEIVVMIGLIWFWVLVLFDWCRKVLKINCLFLKIDLYLIVGSLGWNWFKIFLLCWFVKI